MLINSVCVCARARAHSYRSLDVSSSYRTIIENRRSFTDNGVSSVCYSFILMMRTKENKLYNIAFDCYLSF